MKNHLNAYARMLSEELFRLDADEFGKMIALLLDAYRRDAQVFIAGNGGSAATANHFACDFGKNAVQGGKRRFRILSVCDNIEKITALANDISFDDVFRFQLENLMRPEDVLIVISASGNSPDLLRACEYAKAIGGKVIALSGFGGGRICNGADAALVTPLQSYECIEDLHSAILHMIVCWFKNHQDKLPC